jgi:hypothetical protein
MMAQGYIEGYVDGYAEGCADGRVAQAGIAPFAMQYQG